MIWHKKLPGWQRTVEWRGNHSWRFLCQGNEWRSWKPSDRIFHPSQDTKHVVSILITRVVRCNACANLFGSRYCRHWVCVTKNTRGNYLCIVKR